MSTIEWEESFSVNDPEIDAQHKKWIDIFNNFHNEMLKKGHKDVQLITEEALHAMHDYASYHFKFEEEYMRKHNFPNIVEHRRLHKDFDTIIYEYNKEIREGKYVMCTEIAPILRNWILEHILHEDKKYCRYISQKYK